MHPQLYLASRSGNVSSLGVVAATDQRLLYSEAPQQQTALHISARLGHVDFVREMLRLCGPLVVQPNSYVNTPLHCAATNGRLEVVRLLIENSESRGDVRLLSMRNSQGNTALHEAVMKGYEDVAISLLQADRTLSSIVNNAGMSPLHLAAIGEQPKVVQEILTNLVGQDEIREATRKCDSIGRTALHHAAERDNCEIVNILLQNDLDVAYYHDNHGYSPLHITAATGCWAAFSSLLQKCPDAMEQHDLISGRNVFHISVMNYKWFKKWPKQHQDIVNEPDKDGNTPLHLAAKLLSIRLVFQLLEYGAVDLNVKNKKGLTPLDVAELQNKGHSARRETVITILRKNGGVSGKPRKISPSDQEIEPREVESRARRELTIAFSTASILVATVTFAAVFTMPGGFKSDGTPVLLKHPAFAAFLIFNTLAMCCATIGGICFAVETYVRIFGRVWNVDLWGFFYSALAYVAMLFTFMTAAYLVVAPGCKWLAIVVCLLCCTPILFNFRLFFYQMFNCRPHIYTFYTSPPLDFFGKIVTKML